MINLRDRPKKALLAGIAVTALISVMQGLGFFDSPDLVFIDLGQRLRKSASQHPGIALVLIDDADLEKYGPWPFDRALYARLIKRLVSCGCKGIGLDILFEEKLDRGDKALARAVAAHRDRIVIPFKFIESRDLDPERGCLVGRTEAVPLYGDLAKAVSRRGYVNFAISANPDGVLRKTDLLRRVGGKVEKCFALALCGLAYDTSGLGAGPGELVSIRYRDNEGFLSISLSDALKGTHAADLHDKLVIVGAAAPGLRDVKNTPVGDMPGARVNANLLADIIDSDWIVGLAPGKAAGVCAILGLYSVGCTILFSGRAGVLSVLAAALLWMGQSMALVVFAGRAMPITGAMTALFAAALLCAGLVERREDKVRSLSASEMEQMLEEAEGLEGAGKRDKAIRLVQGLMATKESLPPGLRRRCVTLNCILLARLGESRLLSISLPATRQLPPEHLYRLAVALEEEGYLAQARDALDKIYREDISFADVEERLGRLRLKSRRGELVVNVKGVRELLGHRFSKVRLLAEGGMGIIFSAWDEKLESTVAVKVLHPYLLKEERALKRFLAEVRAVQSLKHENIVRIYEVEMGKAPFFTMEYCDSVTLSRRIEQGGIGREEMLSITKAVSAGLSHAHEGGVVHRDLKPDNILVGLDGCLKLIDFGVAKSRFTTGMTREGELLGTRRYMAPEQEEGGAQVGPAADLYSLGVIMEEMLEAATPGLEKEFRKEFEALTALLKSDDPDRRPRDLASRLENLSSSK